MNELRGAHLSDQTEKNRYYNLIKARRLGSREEEVFIWWGVRGILYSRDGASGLG